MASRLDRARRLLRGQLEALAGLAAVALRLIERGPAQIAFDPRRPLSGVVALERAVNTHARVSWALRLLWALRAKLLGDLARVERGEGVDEVLAAQDRPPVAAQAEAEADPESDPETEAAAERREAFGLEREGLERESFGRYLSGRSGEAEFADILKRPTQEVIALIREALGVSGASDEAAVSEPAGRRGQGLPARRDPGPALRPAAPAPDLRSPSPV